MGSNPDWAKNFFYFFFFFFYIFSFYSILYETIKISYKRWFFNIWHIFLFFKEKIMARAVVKRKTFISINIFDRFHFFWSFHLQHTPLKTNRHILGSSTFFGSFQPFFCSVYRVQCLVCEKNEKWSFSMRGPIHKLHFIQLCWEFSKPF